MYNNIVDLLKVAGETLKKVSNNGHKGVPGWNGHIAELHKVAREAFLLWKDSGGAKQGPIFERKKRSNARFNYALHFIKNNEDAMRAKLLIMVGCHNQQILRELSVMIRLLNYGESIIMTFLIVLVVICIMLKIVSSQKT